MTESKWIRCADRMPEIGEDVLIYPDHKSYSAYWGGEHWHTYEYDENTGPVDIGVSEVTHWQPLSEPPKEDE